MIVRSSKLQKYWTKCYATSVPVLPPQIPTEIVPLTPFKTFKRKNRKFGGNGHSFGNSGGGYPSSSSALIDPAIGVPTGGFKVSADEFVDLFSIYGNILKKEGQELMYKWYEEDQKQQQQLSYPLDHNLLSLFENSIKYWYSAGEMGKADKKMPALMSINGPSRSSTWEMAKHLVGKSGKSHLAVIPAAMFQELLQACSFKGIPTASSVKNEAVKDAKEARELGNFILNNIAYGFKGSNKKTLGFMNSNSGGNSSNSRAVIQVVEYLFACLEESVGSRVEGEERFTLLLDGFEELITTRKGGDAVLKDLGNWANLFESTGRKIVLGGRNQSVMNEESPIEEDGSENNPEDDNNNSNPSNTSSSIITFGKAPPGPNNAPGGSSSSNSPLQVITDLFIKATGGKLGSSETAAANTNVRLEGSILRLLVNGPKNDKRKLLKYSQMVGIDRKRDIFDGNLALLRSIAGNRWNLPLALNLQSKFDFPSSHPEIWTKLSESGRGLLTKRKLSRDEFNEVILYVLGSKRKMTADSLAEAFESVAEIRHDPTRFSSDDLSHLLAERQISLNSLSKYEKRFINCISTATTQTQFSDISLPSGTIKTLRSLTSLPLTHPELFTQGILKNSLTGVLLFGPPGTGKTMLARAVAQESGAAFLAVNMSNIFDMWVGEGEKNVKGMFSLARKLSPSIIFIDEIDALLERRSSISGRSSRLEIVNEFMSQWDGLASNLNSGVVVMGATNRPFVLDDAVLRRLPRRLLIDLPDAQNRLNILLNLLKDNLCESELLEFLPALASKMDFYSGSDLKNVAITAGLKAAVRLASSGKSEEMIISKSDFEEAIREVPASLSDQMDSLIELRKWDEMYGESKKGLDRHATKKFGFA